LTTVAIAYAAAEAAKYVAELRTGIAANSASCSAQHSSPTTTPLTKNTAKRLNPAERGFIAAGPAAPPRS
jgi:hypothetical protein